MSRLRVALLLLCGLVCVGYAAIDYAHPVQDGPQIAARYHLRGRVQKFYQRAARPKRTA